MDILHPWTATEIQSEALLHELEKELSEGHPLFGKPIEIVAKRKDTDDVLVKVPEAPAYYAVVHLTWSRKKERAPWPSTRIFADWEEWVNKCMLLDNRKKALKTD